MILIVLGKLALKSSSSLNVFALFTTGVVVAIVGSHSTNLKECQCCVELEGCDEAMKSEEVIIDLKADGIENAKCITQHPGFNCICLQKWSLKQAAVNYKTKNKTKYSQVGTQNRLNNLFNNLYSCL